MRSIFQTVLVTFTLALGTGCGRHTDLPPIPTPSAGRERVIAQKLFRIGALDFGTRSESSADVSLAAALPAILLTHLHETGRFSVHEGGALRTGDSAPMTEGRAKEIVDGYLNGTITSLSGTEVCFDIRLSNAVNHAVLFARTTCTKVTMEASAGAGAPLKIQPDRSAVKLLADDVARAIKQIGSARVVSSDGGLVFIDKGQTAGVMPGMVAYVVGTGEAVADPAIHRNVQAYSTADAARLASLATPVVVGEVYIMSVEPNYSVGVLYTGAYAVPRDTVFFK